jgi:hypothetical protein
MLWSPERQLPGTTLNLSTVAPDGALSNTTPVHHKLSRLIFLGWIAVPSAALACSPVNLHQTNAETLTAARDAFRSATAVIDAVVVEEAKEIGGRVILRAVQVWKGPPEQIFLVQARDSCDIDYWERGSRLRLVLNGNSGNYWATQRYNGVQVGNPEVFGRELDRLIGNRRPRGFRQPNTRYER